MSYDSNSNMHAQLFFIANLKNQWEGGGNNSVSYSYPEYRGPSQSTYTNSTTSSVQIPVPKQTGPISKSHICGVPTSIFTRR